MKTSAADRSLPYIVEDALEALGERISIARRARGMTQPDLAEKSGIGLSTLLAIEKGKPTVQIGFVLTTLWALGLEGSFGALQSVGADAETSSLMEAAIPLRVRRRKVK